MTPLTDIFDPAVYETPSAADVAIIRDGLRAYNAEYEEQPVRPLTILLRTNARAVIGGLTGWTGLGWLHIDVLWVDETFRGRGLGRAVLAAAEREAMARGSLRAELETLTFQSPGFYERQGYRRFATLDNPVGGHQRVFMEKTLA